MNVIGRLSDLGQLPGPLHLAIGVFDGIHLGHQEVILAATAAAAREGGTAVVITFDPHPIEVLSPRNAPRLLTSAKHKARVLEQYTSARHLCAISFDDAFSKLHGEQFVEQILDASQGSQLSTICVGEGWEFGHGRSGNLSLLKRLGEVHGFSVSGIPIVTVSGERVSSTRVREAVGSGDLAVAERLLGRPYTVYGEVMKGRQLGRQIGFPTANLAVQREQLPPTGVYAVRAERGGKALGGVANLGYRPTVEGEQVKRLLEVHLFNCSEDFYGEWLEVEFVQFLRPEQKFDGVEELKAQIQKDSSRAREVVGA